MKAIRFHQYGGPEVLALQELEKPVPRENEILVRVKAAAINPLDWHMMRGTPYFMRLMTGLTKPKSKYQGFGADMAGVVEETGAKVNTWQIGDEVLGDLFNFGYGAIAEYVVLPEEAVVAKPNSVTYEEAAGMPVAALTAWHGLNKFGPIKTGSKVLINGASGGVGTFAVQLAKYYGAHVTAICSVRNVSLVNQIGADVVIDYTTSNVLDRDLTFDLIFDAVGNFVLSDYKKLLKSDGRCAVVGFGGMSNLIKAGIFGGKQIQMVDFKATQKDLERLTALVTANHIKTVIDRTYSMEEIQEAVTYLETSRAKGKVIITI